MASEAFAVLHQDLTFSYEGSIQKQPLSVSGELQNVHAMLLANMRRRIEALGLASRGRIRNGPRLGVSSSYFKYIYYSWPSSVVALIQYFCERVPAAVYYVNAKIPLDPTCFYESY